MTARADVVAILKRARALLLDRDWCQGGPMRDAQGRHAARPANATAFSALGALMVAAEERGEPWSTGAADEAVRAVHRVALGEKGHRGREYPELADANDALLPAVGRARVVAWMTEAIGVLDKPRSARRGDHA